MREQPSIVIEGIEEVIKRDLSKHKMLLERSKIELIQYRQARTHEIKKKKHYRGLIGKGKYDDDSLEKSIGDIRTNIRHFSDKIKLTNDAIDHHTQIVETLTAQLEDQNNKLKDLATFRSKL